MLLWLNRDRETARQRQRDRETERQRASQDVYLMEAADQDAAAAVESEAVLAAIHARADGDTVAELAAVEAEAAELEAQLAAAQAAAETSAGAEAGHFASECVMAVGTEALKIVFPFPYQQ